MLRQGFTPFVQQVSSFAQQFGKSVSRSSATRSFGTQVRTGAFRNSLLSRSTSNTSTALLSRTSNPAILTAVRHKTFKNPESPWDWGAPEWVDNAKPEYDEGGFPINVPFVPPVAPIEDQLDAAVARRYDLLSKFCFLWPTFCCAFLTYYILFPTRTYWKEGSEVNWPFLYALAAFNSVVYVLTIYTFGLFHPLTFAYTVFMYFKQLVYKYEAFTETY